MARKELEEYVERLMHYLKGQSVAKKVSVLKESVLYWYNSSLFWREVHGELRKVDD